MKPFVFGWEIPPKQQRTGGEMARDSEKESAREEREREKAIRPAFKKRIASGPVFFGSINQSKKVKKSGKARRDWDSLRLLMRSTSSVTWRCAGRVRLLAADDSLLCWWPWPPVSFSDRRSGRLRDQLSQKKLNKTRLLFVLKTLGRKTLLALHNHVKANRTE